MDILPIRTMAWLKTYGHLKEDGWWVMPKAHAGNRFITSLRWEVEPEDYLLRDDGSVYVLLDWDGALDILPPNELMSEMAIIGHLAGKSGWAPLKNLSMLDDMYVRLKLTDYHVMVDD